MVSAILALRLDRLELAARLDVVQGVLDRRHDTGGVDGLLLLLAEGGLEFLVLGLQDLLLRDFLLLDGGDGLGAVVVALVLRLGVWLNAVLLAEV